MQYPNARHCWQATDAQTMMSEMAHTKEPMTVKADGTTMRMIPTLVGAHGDGLRHPRAYDAGSQRHGSDAHADGCSDDDDELKHDCNDMPIRMT